SEPNARTEIAALELARGMWKIQNLRLQVEYGALIVSLRGRKVERIAHAQVQRELGRYLPIVTGKEFRNVRTRLDHVFLNVDGEGVYLPEEQRRQGIAAARYRGAVGPGGGEGKGAGGVGRVQHIQSLAAKIDSEFPGMPAAHQREGVHEFRDGSGEVR